VIAGTCHLVVTGVLAPYWTLVQSPRVAQSTTVAAVRPLDFLFRSVDFGVQTPQFAQLREAAQQLMDVSGVHSLIGATQRLSKAMERVQPGLC